MNVEYSVVSILQKIITSRRASAKYARAKGMVDVLTWVIGGKGVPDPMSGFEDVSEPISCLILFFVAAKNKLDTVLSRDFLLGNTLVKKI